MLSGRLTRFLGFSTVFLWGSCYDCKTSVRSKREKTCGIYSTTVCSTPIAASCDGDWGWCVAAGIAVIATRDNASEEQIADEETGLFVPYEDPLR
jgi:hypothetical protein